MHLDVKPEYSPKWASGKRYDDYLPKYNIIIENHGVQHYADYNSFNMEHNEIKENDDYKYKLAIKNGIEKYIVLDCRYSNINWIRKSIMTSELPDLLSFTESDINWEFALEYASNNLMYTIKDLYLTRKSLTDISKELNISLTTVRKYLKTATQLGLCDYNPQIAKQEYYNRNKLKI